MDNFYAGTFVLIYVPVCGHFCFFMLLRMLQPAQHLCGELLTVWAAIGRSCGNKIHGFLIAIVPWSPAERFVIHRGFYTVMNARFGKSATNPYKISVAI